MARVRLLPAVLLLLLPLAGCSRKAARIEVTPKKLKIYGLDRPQRLTGRLLDKKERPVEIGTPNWDSANPAIATVDNAGLVTPKAEGKTRIIAKYEAVSSEIPIEIIDVKSIEITPTTVQLVGPSGIQISVQAKVKNSRDAVIRLPVVWSASHPEVATVSADGVVTALSKGVSTLTAKIGDVQAIVEITVDIRNLTRIEIRPMTALVRVGDSQAFQVIAYDVDGHPIEGPAARFASSDPSIATISSGGGASGVRPGAAIVRASIGSLTAEATLIVN